MQRGVEQADRDREPGHRLEEALEVGLLEREQLVERLAPARLVGGHDHPLHLRLAVGRHEHVLCPAEADPLGAEPARALGVLRGVGVGPHAQCAQLVGPAEHRLEALVDLGDHERDVVERDGTRAAVEADQVAGAQRAPVDVDLALAKIDVHVPGAGHGRPAHAARHQGGVGGLAAL